MARRNEGLLDLLVMAPWWVSVIVATGAYIFFAYVFPVLFSKDAFSAAVAKGMAQAAPLVALVLLLPAPVAAFREWRARQLLASQTGIDSIRSMTWRQFETLVAEAYRRQGFAVEERGGGGPDGGIDLVIRKNGTFLVQCKRWKSYRVGVKEVRELLGLVTAEQAAGGVLITSGEFTPDARDFARGRALELVDGTRLAQLVRTVQNGPSASTPLEGPATTSIVGDPAGPACPVCGRGMKLRTARRGNAAGTRFWGCSGYPGCRGTVNA